MDQRYKKNLYDIILLFRFGKFTFSSDIRFFFRHILVNPEHTSLQNILWRNDPSQAIKYIRLDSVTYGMKSSSYVATRCLLELAQRYEHDLPLAAFIIKKCTYVDNILYSCSDMHQLLKAKRQLCKMLSYGSFKLHK